ncbi:MULTISPECIES: DUF2804 domain-containing protein [Oxalobacteraceae]|jgi:hypothetical protein|uniref:DUF2804 domain-containing protein n=1 Tax=Oxalobacteraceae TaxID=75682 RepID=UPI0010A470A0|nr:MULTISPECIES: DUF2804 domain-containing protein [Oxalobacteraceae]
MRDSPEDRLPAAPRQIPERDGQARFGRFAGSAASIDWSRLAAPYARSALWRRFHHKRWQYIALATEELFCGLAIVDLGWTNTAFAYAFDRRLRKEVAAYSQNGLPGLGARVAKHPGQGSAFHWLGNHIVYEVHDGQRHRLALHCGAFRIEAEFLAAGCAPLLLAVGPVCGGSVHATQKSSGMPLTGKVQAGQRAYDLQGGVASFDYSNGLLARETAWQWASAHNLELGFNLQSGYFGDQENALWLDGRLIPLGAARFEHDPADPLAPWHIRTDDGLLDLRFQPEGARREDKNLLIAASRYVQPVGSFSGWVKSSSDAAPRTVTRLVGVTEDHFSRW